MGLVLVGLDKINVRRSEGRYVVLYGFFVILHKAGALPPQYFYFKQRSTVSESPFKPIVNQF